VWPYRLMPDRSGPSKLGEAARLFKDAFSMGAEIAIEPIALTTAGLHRGLRVSGRTGFGPTSGYAAPGTSDPGSPVVGAPDECTVADGP
jgi:hypothetical protein